MTRVVFGPDRSSLDGPGMPRTLSAPAVALHAVNTSEDLPVTSDGGQTWTSRYEFA
jgi:hypothetical protein